MNMKAKELFSTFAQKLRPRAIEKFKKAYCFSVIRKPTAFLLDISNSAAEHVGYAASGFSAVRYWCF